MTRNFCNNSTQTAAYIALYGGYSTVIAILQGELATMQRLTRSLFALALLSIANSPSIAADTDYGAWPLLTNPFESTGGGGVMIDGYKPVVAGRTCTTDFSVKMPDGAVYENEIVFEAKEIQGGVLCTAGRWRAKDGSASGTTPFEVFIRDGAVRRSPPG